MCFFINCLIIHIKSTVITITTVIPLQIGKAMYFFNGTQYCCSLAASVIIREALVTYAGYPELGQIYQNLRKIDKTKPQP